MQCNLCSEKAIIKNPPLCKKHFNEYIINKVGETIKEFNLFTKKSKIAVGVSGGKDSLALLHILKKLGYDVEGLFVDEGIENYREKSKEDLKLFVEKNKIKLTKVSFEEEAGFTLDQAMKTKKYHACTVCGTLRRYLLNKHTKNYDVIATGHNLDDEAQTIIINLARANTDLLLRAGPKSEPNKQFTQKVKPFYYITEKQILTYVIINNIRVDFGECPYAYTSYRAQVRDLLNKIESEKPGTKLNIIKKYLELKNELTKQKQTPEHLEDIETKKETNIQVCEQCGEASKEKICKACQLKNNLNKIIN